MAKRSISDEEIGLIKAMLARGTANKNIQFWLGGKVRSLSIHWAILVAFVIFPTAFAEAQLDRESAVAAAVRSPKTAISIATAYPSAAPAIAAKLPDQAVAISIAVPEQASEIAFAVPERALEVVAAMSEYGITAEPKLALHLENFLFDRAQGWLGKEFDDGKITDLVVFTTFHKTLSLSYESSEFKRLSRLALIRGTISSGKKSVVFTMRIYKRNIECLSFDPRTPCELYGKKTAAIRKLPIYLSYMILSQGIQAAVALRSDHVEDMAFLPWPLFEPTARGVVTGQLENASYAGISQNIRRLLRDYGYKNHLYFAIPEGFAVLTPLERISKHGQPASVSRWKKGKVPFQGTINGYFEHLIKGDQSLFRVMIFLVSPRRIRTIDEKLASESLDGWRATGNDEMEASISRIKTSKETRVEIFVYQFEVVPDVWTVWRRS